MRFSPAWEFKEIHQGWVTEYQHMSNRGRYPQGAENVARHPGLADRERAEQLLQEERAEAEQKARDQAAAWVPSNLPEAEREVWLRVCPELILAGRMKPLFSDSLQQYCEVLVRMNKLRQELDEVDWVYVTTGRHGKQYKSRPQVAQLNDDFRKFTQLVAHFGMSPATEMRYAAARQGDLFDNEFDQLD